MQSDSDSEIEDLMNPTGELKKKIVDLAVTIREWNIETRKVRKIAKKQFEEILSLGLKKRNMEKTALRRLVEDLFRIHGVSDSWIRKQLPPELKDSSKIRISYLQKQEIKKERQRLLQHEALISQQESESKEFDFPNDSTVESVSFQTTEPELNQSSPEPGIETHYVYNDSLVREPNSSLSNEFITTQNELSEANKKVEKLEEIVQWLSKPFTARTYLQAGISGYSLSCRDRSCQKVHYVNSNR